MTPDEDGSELPATQKIGDSEKLGVEVFQRYPIDSTCPHGPQDPPARDAMGSEGPG
jgi:hypothetical protein